MPGPNKSTTTTGASTSTSMSTPATLSTSTNATTGMKTLSRGTLSLRFMQNAQRAKQQQAVEVERKEIVDETKWEISRDILKEKWGEEGRGGEDGSTVTYESSYLPFMFSSAPPSRSSGRATAERPQSDDSDDEEDEEGNDSDNLGFNLLSLALRGRRKWKKGQERFESQGTIAKNQETRMADTAGNNEGDDDSDDSHPRPPPEDPAYTKNRPHIAKGRGLLRPLSQSLSKPGIVLKGYDKAQRGRSAREAIMDTAGVGEDLRTSMRKSETVQGDTETTIVEEKRPLGFMKPSGVDEPSKKPSKPPKSDMAEAGELSEDESDRDGMTLPELSGCEPAIMPQAKDRTSVVKGARDRQFNKKLNSQEPGKALNSTPERVEGLGLDVLASAESSQAGTKGKRGRIDDDGSGQNKKRRKKKGAVNFVE